ncbi:MAG: precorrin-6y C5,15-methyltransferase (decarboxylating) subunit CbiE [Acidimicrobiales bacterium]
MEKRSSPLPEPIIVVGVSGRIADLPNSRIQEIIDAPIVVGAPRLKTQVDELNARFVPISPRMRETLESLNLEGGGVVLASGDPGFFGATRLLATIFGTERLRIHPAPSSVALAFARCAIPWDDAVVVSAHGRPLSDAIAKGANATKAAYLLSPENPPERLAQELVRLGYAPSGMVVAERLGEPDEAVIKTTVAEAAMGRFDPLSVAIVLSQPQGAVAPNKSLAFGAPDENFVHRDGMITKSEIRAVILSKLALPRSGRLLDIGAGSGSVGIEVSLLSPALDVIAIDSDFQAIAQIKTNAVRQGANITAAHGDAQDLIPAYAPFDRAFVGGGGLDTLRLAIAHCSPGGIIVASYAAIDRAAEAASLLGSLVEVSISRGVRLPDGGTRLQAQNPTFVTWGTVP